ncbi:MAG: hypothetical protein V1731_01330 [Candidatus Aenigmatarchaeota archaeon]
MKTFVLFLIFLLVVPGFVGAAWVKCDDWHLGAREAAGSDVFQCVKDGANYQWLRMTTVTTLPSDGQKADYFKTVFAAAFAITCNMVCPACCAPLLKTID